MEFMSIEHTSSQTSIFKHDLTPFEKLKIAVGASTVGALAVASAFAVGNKILNSDEESGPTQCFEGVMTESGIRKDLIDELKFNPNIPNVSKLHGLRDASSQIAEQISDPEQTGDTYTYGVTPGGKVVGECTE